MTDYSQEFGEGVDRLYEVMESEGLPQPDTEHKRLCWVQRFGIQRRMVTYGLLPKLLPKLFPKLLPKLSKFLHSAWQLEQEMKLRSILA